MIINQLYSFTPHFHLFQCSDFNLQSSVFRLPTSLSLINSIQIILLTALLIYALYYAYETFFGKTHQPRLWKQQVKEGNISKALQKAESRYKDGIRFYTWWFMVEQLKKQKIPGHYAELGVYKGDSAEILHLMDEDRNFHLFDTFSGFQEKDLKGETGKAATYTPHDFADTSLQRVKERLSSNQFFFHQGDFSKTQKEVENEQFALVNMDVDLYIPTKAGLEFFYPRLSPGGVIFVHDYNPDWPGIIKAVDEFITEFSVHLIHIPDNDDTVIIRKG